MKIIQENKYLLDKIIDARDRDRGGSHSGKGKASGNGRSLVQPTQSYHLAMHEKRNR